MTCQGAWDNDEVTNSIWHPGGSGAGASTAIYMGEELIIHRVTVRQFRVSRIQTFHVLYVCDVNSELLLQFRNAEYFFPPHNTIMIDRCACIHSLLHVVNVTCLMMKTF